jgi:hypothetical protein
MSAHIAYLDGNAGAGELSKIFSMDVTAALGKLSTAEQLGGLPRPVCTWKVLASLPGAVFASTCSFEL